MDGLLAFLETILVFSLTYIALATAASALSGAGLRMRRTRARGLRSMVEYLYRNNLIPLLEKLDAEIQEKTDADKGPFSELIAAHRRDPRPQQLCKFVVDMTFLPVVTEMKSGLPEGGEDPRVAKVARDNWISLAHSQDSLSLEEFDQRLAESDIGREVARVLTEELDRKQDIAIEFERLRNQFAAQQRGATNWFARTARVWSIGAGFLIALGLNVDSVDLFGSYLDDPSLRRDVLDRQERILQQAEAGQVASDPTVDGTATQAERELATALEQVKALRAELGDILSDENFRELELLVDGEKLDALLGETRDAAETAEASLQSASELVEDVRLTAQTLTTQFPIGWDRFPGCEQIGSDGRCALLQAEKMQPAEGWVSNFLYGLCVLPGEHIKWLLGLLITGFLVGLGAPFWVEVFNNLLRARKLVDDLRQKPS